MALEFSRDDERSRYVAVEDGRQRGLIDFDTDGDTVTILHTETNPGDRGRGIADQLTRYAVDDLRARELKIVPQCPFTKAWFDSHPDESDLVV